MMLTKEAIAFEQAFSARGYVNDHVIALGSERSTALLRWVEQERAAVIGVLKLAQEFDPLEERSVTLIERGEDLEYGGDGLGTETVRHLHDRKVSDLPPDAVAALWRDMARSERALHGERY
jgi:hypothetical protein